MYLEKLEIQGFKSFASKIVLSFPRKQKKNPGIAAIVGPNGAGKSNIADAVRWVLGEQSLKIIRGKRAEDVIFAGSGVKTRLGFAEVEIFLNNEDKTTNVDYEHISVKRRVYRDGTGEYYINNSKVRLSDVQMLLAQANFGQRTYSVIGQGMVDAILSASPEERKNFFDEATGVKQYQIKREQASVKIKSTEQNLSQVSGLLKEIKPRLASLNRQVKRLEKRSVTEQNLQDLQIRYYGNIWQNLKTELDSFEKQKKSAEEEYAVLTKKILELQNQLSSIEKNQNKEGKNHIEKIQSEYKEAIEKKNKLIMSYASIEKEILIFEQTLKSEENPANAKILLKTTKKYLEFLKKITNASTIEDFKKIQSEAKHLLIETEKLINTDQGEKQETSKDSLLKKQSLEKLAILREEIMQAEKLVKEKEENLENISINQTNATTGVFKIQKEYQLLQQKLYEITNKKNSIEVNLARLQTRKEDIEIEIDKETRENIKEKIKNYSQKKNQTEDLWPFIAKEKHELEMIGGIDPEINDEHKETKNRHDFLETQTSDLENALEKTKKAIKELDLIIEKEFEKSFLKIEKYFGEYFKILFRGGTATLEKNKENELDSISEEIASGLTEEEKERLSQNYKIGITIKATPPNKKVHSINMLSGGEKALTSIALISAIIKANPSPFVVLDEVDAALDESNSQRFADILSNLASITQFIAITHNRATMEKSDILYGITIGSDGVSKLLSVDIEKAQKVIKK